MIITELYDGQGLGNQLWCYFVTRIIAKRNGYDYGIMGQHKFKAREFMELNFGKEVVGGSGPEGGPPTTLPTGITEYYKERLLHHPISKLDITPFDDYLVNVSDNTKLDGGMQSYYYVKDYRDEIVNQISVNTKGVDLSFLDDENVCIIHVRGGDFRSSSAMLGRKYYNDAINHLKTINPDMKFYVVTDDKNTAHQILPNVEIVGASLLDPDSNMASHHMGGPVGVDYAILSHAKHAIISASSFSWWPVWTNNKIRNVVAPKYWAAHKQSDGYWSCGDSIIEGWTFLDRDGKIFTYEECQNEIL